MPIQFKCEYCGKKVTAPDAAGGKRGKCPFCKQTCYIPAPVADEELYDLAPESEEDRRREAAEKEALRQQEAALLAELGGEAAAAVPVEQKENPTPDDLHHLVVNYCLDIADGRLDRAELTVGQMKKLKRTAMQAVDDFLSGKAKEPALAHIPPPVLKGLLNQLKQALT
jgi:hypothetical protein